MVNYQFKERKQNKSRIKYGSLEKNKDAINRLKQLNKDKKEIISIENQIKDQTGYEFFFKMENTQRSGHEIVKKIEDLEGKENNELRKILKFLNLQESKYQKKIKSFPVKPKCKHLFFEDFGHDASDMNENSDIDFNKNEEHVQEIQKYLDEISKCKEKINLKLNNK